MRVSMPVDKGLFAQAVALKAQHEKTAFITLVLGAIQAGLAE